VAGARRGRGAGPGGVPPRGVLRAALFALAAALGCGPALPDPDAPGAAVLRPRCGGCHRLYAPGSMTVPMWPAQIERMHGLFAQRGLPGLSAHEEREPPDYLRVHAGTSC